MARMEKREGEQIRPVIIMLWDVHTAGNVHTPRVHSSPELPPKSPNYLIPQHNSLDSHRSCGPGATRNGFRYGIKTGRLAPTAFRMSSARTRSIWSMRGRVDGLRCRTSKEWVPS